MDPEEAAAAVVAVFSQADAGESSMALGTRAFAREKQNRRRMVQPVPSRHPRADHHLRQEAGVVAGEAYRVRASRVVAEATAAADALRNRGKIPGCMKH